ncbi:MAG: phosphate ABC transporter permease subunit PstC [Atopobiaceae bacterium]|jgi:phosphate transport system permease protein|nr:phosphate ABC transporter permease subunit PstC [Olegusella sp.]MCI1934399.1 phosphate ABC transporter permease subunit PstC [Atopobiaceae bacterium]
MSVHFHEPQREADLKGLIKPPHIDAIEPNKGAAYVQGTRMLKLVDRRTYRKERALQYLFLACALIAVLAVVLIFVFTFGKSIPVFTDIGLAEFFSGTWSPSEGRYGIATLLAGSLLVTAGALAIGMPLAVGCAVYLTEIASKRTSRVVSTAVDLLAGIPSVIYGFFGLVVLRPLIASQSGGLGFGAFTAWLVLAIMIVPTITTLSMDALNSVDDGIRQASYSMGATRWQTIYKVVLPAAKVGIVNAVVLGMGRAIGETMAVLMVVGNAPVVPASIFDPISTLTSQIALDMGYSSGLHRSALFGMGVVLYVISACLVGIVRAATTHSERRDHQAGASASAEDRQQASVSDPHSAPAAGSVQESSAKKIRERLERAPAPRISKGAANATMSAVFRATGAIVSAMLALIIAFVVINGAPQISLDFIFGWPQGVNAEGGIWPTIVSTLYVTALATLFSTPVAVLAAVYLAEYAHQGRLVSFIRYAADTLASVPSIVMGLFGYALFVEAMGFGLSMLSASLALALLMLPLIMRTTEDAIRAVPRYIRWGAYGLGATKWQVVSRIVLPAAFPRIATGIVLAIGRAIGETAIVLYTMGQAVNLPVTPLDSGRSMPVHLYLLANDGINMGAAYGTALLLMIMILIFNLAARAISRRSVTKGGSK